MRIAIDARFYRSSTGGIGRYARGLVKELSKIDDENEYTVIISRDDLPEFDIKKDNFKPLVVDFIHYTIAEQTKFLKLLNDHRFDLVHFTNFNHPILYNGKFVITVHDLTLMLFPYGRQKSSIKQFAFRAVMKNAINHAEKIISISKATENDLVKYLSADTKKIDVIYEGIDSSYAQNLKIKTQSLELRKKYNLQNPYILFVSQWRPHKGLPDLVKAFEILKEKYNVEQDLVIVGKPNKEFPDVIDAINNSKFAKNIVKPGFIDEADLPLIYQNADLFVFPSHYEGFGLPPLEAMASGIPVVASNISCMPEILGDAAEYFDPNNSADIAEKIYGVLSMKDKQKSMINKGFDQIKKYSWHKMAEETLRVYQEATK
jgi:glycosyltransferase involved in cell wall biosynthesis